MYLRFHYNQGYGSEQYVILPYVDNIVEVSLWFYAKALTENAAIFVGVMTDPNDVSTFETAFEIDNLTSDYQQCNVSIDLEYFNDQTHYIAIKSAVFSRQGFAPPASASAVAPSGLFFFRFV